MIISHLIGGLGNQMFQYAMGRSCALALGVELRLHVADYATYGVHQGFELDRVFGAQFHIATTDDVRGVLGWCSSQLCRRVLKHHNFSLLRGKHFVVEPDFQYWPGAKAINDNSYLMGYWQSEKYFSEIATTLMRDFQFNGPVDGRNAELAEAIAAVNAVSLHVRRGDYVSNPKANATHGLCSLEYYKNAIKHVTERVAHPEFFVFSDDVPWVKHHIEMEFPCTYVDHNSGAASYNDMRLMSLCRHHVLANSSFSWWGAWLNPRPDKIVVAPARWFANGKGVADLIPREWIML